MNFAQTVCTESNAPALVSAIATVVLVLVTWKYVSLTKKLSEDNAEMVAINRETLRLAQQEMADNRQQTEELRRQSHLSLEKMKTRAMYYMRVYQHALETAGDAFSNRTVLRDIVAWEDRGFDTLSDTAEFADWAPQTIETLVRNLREFRTDADLLINENMIHGHFMNERAVPWKKRRAETLATLYSFTGDEPAIE
ncbi:MAG: hypothetical protein ABI229_06200 [Gemmatimonadaceae bacterium]